METVLLCSDLIWFVCVCVCDVRAFYASSNSPLVEFFHVQIVLQEQNAPIRMTTLICFSLFYLFRFHSLKNLDLTHYNDKFIYKRFLLNKIWNKHYGLNNPLNAFFNLIVCNYWHKWINKCKWHVDTSNSIVSNELRNICGERFLDRFRRILPLRSTSVGRWTMRPKWNLRSRRSIYVLVGQWSWSWWLMGPMRWFPFAYDRQYLGTWWYHLT